MATQFGITKDTRQMPAIYDKPVRLLMKDMANDFALSPGEPFTRQRALDWFSSHYPKINVTTVNCHLIRFSTNIRARLSYRAKPGEDDVFYQMDSTRFRLYDPARDPPPIHSTEGSSDERTSIENEVEVEVTGSSEFAYEKDLRNYLAKNLSIIEPGLTLFEEDDIPGVEYPVGGRFIDILAVDSRGDLVVIELKVERGYDRVVGQLMRYIGWIQKNLADAGQKVRGVIVARKISEDLLLACSLMPTVGLFEYELSLKLKPVSTSP